jgi:hypothetical protein
MKYLIGCITFCIILALVLVGWTDSNLDWLLTMIKGQPVDVPMWISVIFSILFNGILLAFNIIVELLKLIL